MSARPAKADISSIKRNRSFMKISEEKNMSVKEKSSLELYIEEIGSENCSPLEIQKENELLKKASAGDRKAQDKIIRANLRYVVSVAKKFAKGNVELDDLVQAGNEALFESFATFDYDKFAKSGCNRFISYAGRRIAQKIALEAKGGIDVSISEGKFKDLKKLQKEMASIDGDMDEMSRVEKAAISLGIKKSAALNLYNSAETASSLEYKSEEDGRKLEEKMPCNTFASPDEEALMNANSEVLKKSIVKLGKIEEEVLTLAYGLDGNEALNYPAIGKILGYTREGIRIVHNRAINHLKEEMGLAA